MTDATLIGRRRSRPAVRSVVRPSASVPMLLAVSGALVGLGWLTFLLLRRADGLATPAFDQAFFQQVVWNASQGRGFVSSFSGGNFLGLHFSPLLVVPALIETIWADARVLTVLHALSLAAAGPAAFVFLRAALRPSSAGPWLAAAIAAPLPIWSAMQEAGRADFHTESLALPLALLAAWAGIRGRTAALLAFVAVVLLAKEDQGFTVLVIGAFIAARAPGRLWRDRRLVPGRRALGLGLMVLGAAWSLVVVAVAMPALRAGAPLDTGWYYTWLADNGGPLSQLDRIGAQLGNVRGWMAAAGLVLSSAALGLLRPAWLLFLLPPVIASLLSANGVQADLKQHYVLLPLLPALIAAAMGGRRLLAWLGRRRWLGVRIGSSWRPALLALALPAVVVAWVGGGLPPTMRTERGQWDRPAAREELLRFAAAVPDDVMLVVDDALAVPLASRLAIDLVPASRPDAWVLIDRLAYVPPYQRVNERTAFLDGLPGSGRPLLADDGRFELWGPIE